MGKLEKYEEAIASYDKAIELKSDHYSTWNNRGWALANLEIYEDAIASYDKAIEIEPGNYSTWYARGVALSDLKKYEEALVSYDKAIEIKPDLYYVWNNRGLALANLRRYENALASYDKAIELKSDDYDTWNNQGTALISLEQYEQAVASYDKAIEIKPSDNNAWNNRGLSLNYLGQYENAIASLDQAIKLKPDDNNAWNNRGNVLNNLQEYEQALISCNKAIEIKPDDYNPWYNRGIALANLEKYEDAIASFEKAVEIKPDFDDAWNRRGIVLCDNLREYKKALSSFVRAIEIKPNFYDAWYNKGVVLANLEKNESAITCYEKAIELKPDYYNAWNNQGNVLNNLGRYEDALASFDKAIEIKPDLYYAWSNRGLALANLGRYEDAIASYDKAIKIQPEFYNGWRNRGLALVNLGRYEDAIASYDKAIEFKPEFYDTWSDRGLALVNLGRYEEAIASCNKAIELKPEFYDSWNTRGAILCDKLRKYEEAIASFDEALRLTDYQYWLAWSNKGIALLNSQGYKAAVKCWNNGIKTLKPDTPNYEEGCGELHRKKGEILYIHGKKQANPFPDWFDAKDSYEQALNFLSFEKFPQRHLQVLQESLQVYSTLGDKSGFQRHLEEATQRLEQLLAKSENKGSKISLARKFAAFNQMRVDLRLQSNDENKEIAALELAEQRKNTCLAWLQENWDYQPPQFTYKDMQRLLNPKTAAIYWHISPNVITTFIIKYNKSPIVLSPADFLQNSSQQESSFTHLEQLQSFQTWMEKWKQTYQNYCQGDYTSETKETASWRQNIEYMLLNELRDILEINRLREYLTDVEQLILVPHRELHLLPLDYLFPSRFNVTYLPSFQIGLKLVAQSPSKSNQVKDKQSFPALLNITTNDSPFTAIESIALATLYPNCRELKAPEINQKSLITALKQSNNGYFHFTGHGDHIPEQPRESFLQLTQTDKLTLGDIVDDKQLDLSHYELICLSACETGITSAESLVDEYVGLVSAFLAKGASYVINSLWTVDERSTALLMIQFYQLLQQGNTANIALKQAKQWLRQLTYEDLAQWYLNLAAKLKEPQCIDYLKTEALMIKSDRNKMISNKCIYDHPYYWAGFILTGKPA